MKIERALSWPLDVLGPMSRYRKATGLGNYAATAGSHSVASKICLIIMLLAGSAMQGYANGTIDVFLVAFFLLIAGYTVVGLAFQGKLPEIRAFLLTYAV
jgi:general stress protein CsbA